MKSSSSMWIVAALVAMCACIVSVASLVFLMNNGSNEVTLTDVPKKPPQLADMPEFKGSPLTMSAQSMIDTIFWTNSNCKLAIRHVRTTMMNSMVAMWKNVATLTQRYKGVVRGSASYASFQKEFKQLVGAWTTVIISNMAEFAKCPSDAWLESRGKRDMITDVMYDVDKLVKDQAAFMEGTFLDKIFT